MALSVDGVDDDIDHGDVAGLDGAAALSGMFWVWIDDIRANAGFVGKGTGAATTFEMRTNSADGSRYQVSVQAGQTQEASVVAGTLVAEVWMHLAFVYDGGQTGNSGRLRLYVDGSERAVTFTGTIPATLGNTGGETLRVGVSDDSGIFSDCRIAHPRLWTAALAFPEILQEVQSYRASRRASLVLDSPYDDGVRANDYSGRGNHGVVTGALQVSGPPVSYGAGAWRRDPSERLWRRA